MRLSILIVLTHVYVSWLIDQKVEAVVQLTADPLAMGNLTQLYAVLGQDIILRCQSDTPGRDWTWIRDQRTIATNHSRHASVDAGGGLTRFLSIMSASIEDTGTYCCQVDSEKSNRLHVNVLLPPIFTSVSSNFTKYVNQSITMTVTVETFQKFSMTVGWYHMRNGSKKIVKTEFYFHVHGKVDDSYHISTLREEDGGQYIVGIETAYFNSIKTDMWLTVIAFPVFTRVPSNFTKYVTQSITMTVTVETFGKCNMTVVWYHTHDGSMKIVKTLLYVDVYGKVDDSYYISTLRAEDGGQYIVSIETAYDIGIKTAMWLNVIGHPANPQNVQIMNSDHGVLKVFWEHPQQKTNSDFIKSYKVHIRVDGNMTWHLHPDINANTTTYTIENVLSCSLVFVEVASAGKVLSSNWSRAEPYPLRSALRKPANDDFIVYSDSNVTFKYRGKAHILALSYSEDELDDNFCMLLTRTANSSYSPPPATLLDNYCFFISPARGLSIRSVRDTVADCPTYDMCSTEQKVSTICHLGEVANTDDAKTGLPVWSLALITACSTLPVVLVIALVMVLVKKMFKYQQEKKHKLCDSVTRRDKSILDLVHYSSNCENAIISSKCSRIDQGAVGCQNGDHETQWKLDETGQPVAEIAKKSTNVDTREKEAQVQQASQQLKDIQDITLESRHNADDFYQLADTRQEIVCQVCNVAIDTSDGVQNEASPGRSVNETSCISTESNHGDSQLWKCQTSLIPENDSVIDVHITPSLQTTNSSISGATAIHNVQSNPSLSGDSDTRPRLGSSLLCLSDNSLFSEHSHIGINDHEATLFSNSSSPCTVNTHSFEQQLEHVALLGAQPCPDVAPKRKISTERSNALELSELEMPLVAMSALPKEVEDTKTASGEDSQMSAAESEDDIDIPISELLLEVGPDGGSASCGDMSLFVPYGAVDTNVELVARRYIYTDKHKFPQVDTSKEYFFFSPVLSLEPHGYQFKQPVLVRCPFSAMPGGWQLGLLRADCREAERTKHWEEIVTYNTDTGEVTTKDCDYDVDLALLAVTHFCDHCWYGRSLKDTVTGRKQLYCSVFGYQLRPKWHRWILEIFLHDYCEDIFEKIVKQKKRTLSQWQLLDGPVQLTISKDGDIKCEFLSRSWQLKKLIKPFPSQQFWNKWFGNLLSRNFPVVLKPGESIERAYEINLTVVGPCDSVELIVTLPQDGTKTDTLSPPSFTMDFNQTHSLDSGLWSDVENTEGVRQRRPATVARASPTARATSCERHAEIQGHQRQMPQQIDGCNSSVVSQTYNITNYNVSGTAHAAMGPGSSVVSSVQVVNGPDELGLCGGDFDLRQVPGARSEASAQIASSENLAIPELADYEYDPVEGTLV